MDFQQLGGDGGMLHEQEYAFLTLIESDRFPRLRERRLLLGRCACLKGAGLPQLDSRLATALSFIFGCRTHPYRTVPQARLTDSLFDPHSMSLEETGDHYALRFVNRALCRNH